MSKKIKKAFTLAETIMTLFIVGLVVIAAVPVFTKKPTNTMNSLDKPWGVCQTDTNTGLCEASYERSSGGATYYPPIVIGGDLTPIDDPKCIYETGDCPDKYDLTIKSADASDASQNMYDIFQSDYRKFRVNNYTFNENQTNLFISPVAENVLPTGTNNLLIGTISNADSVSDFYHNTLIGLNNTIANRATNNVIIGNNNTISEGNSITVGQNNVPQANSALFGSYMSPSTSSLALAFGTLGSSIDPNPLQLGNDIWGTGGHELVFNGDVLVNGRFTTNIAYSVSDERLKNIKGEYTKGLSDIKKIEPVIFSYKSDKTKTKHVGVIAQDLQKIFPEAVSTMPSGYYGVNEDPVFFAMANSLQEINKKIKTEEAKQQELEKELNALSEEIKTLTACKSDNSFLGRIKCFLYDIKLFFKSLIFWNRNEVKYE